jgi:small-conductance mechanosensitive channel
MSGLFSGLGISEFLTPDRVVSLVWALVTFLVGIFLARMISSAIGRSIRKRAGAHEALLVRRLAFYGLLAIVIVVTMQQLGFKPGVLLGTAGILSIAIGFASQTSVSNLISGLFLMTERPFTVGDQLEVDGRIGEVLSVDLLSVKLRMFDNVMMRVPNEHMIKSTVLVRTRFPIRRVDVQIGVAYKEDTAKVREILFEVADRNPLCLDEPAPRFIYKGYGDSALELQFSVWSTRENFFQVRTGLHEQIKTAFDEQGIEIPFPHRTLYTGSVTEPFPVRVIDGTKDAQPAPGVAEIAREET